MRHKELLLPLSLQEWQTPSRWQNQLQDLAHYLRTLSFNEFSITLDISLSSDIETRSRVLESYDCCESIDLNIILIKGKKIGSTTCSGSSLTHWKESVDKAILLMEYAQEDPFVGLLQDYNFSGPYAPLETFFPQAMTAHDMVERALLLEDIALAHKDITHSQGAHVGICYDLGFALNSAGLNIMVPRTSYSQSIEVMSGPVGAQESDGALDQSIDYKNLLDPEKIALLAQQRALLKQGAKKMRNHRLPVVFSPRCSGSLIGHLFSAMSGRSQYMKSSFLLDALDQELLPSWISIQDNPHLNKSLYSTAIDEDGLKTYPHHLVEKGHLKEYLLSVYSSRRLGLKPNALSCGPRNVTMTRNIESQKAILESFKECLLVDELFGSGVNPTTGDYSKGVRGFLVKKGEIIHPVIDTTIASNLKDMYQKVAFHAPDYEAYRSYQIGSLAIEEMAISSGD